MANEFVPRKTDASMNPAARTLPAGASATVYSASIDLNAVTPFIPGNTEFELVTPTVNNTMLPDTRVLTYSIEDSADDSSFAALLVVSKATQTGADNTGAAGATTRIALPSSVRRYIRLNITSGASVGNCSSVSATLKIRIAP
jgi:hypothetical protein